MFQRGCNLPKAGGKYPSSPATNGKRAAAAKYAPAAPMLLKAITTPANAVIPKMCSRAAVCAMHQAALLETHQVTPHARRRRGEALCQLFSGRFAAMQQQPEYFLGAPVCL